MEREHSTGILEGQMETLSMEAGYLRDQVAELQERVVKAESMKGRHVHEKEQLRQELRQATDRAISLRADKAEASLLEEKASTRSVRSGASKGCARADTRSSEPKC